MSNIRKASNNRLFVTRWLLSGFIGVYLTFFFSTPPIFSTEIEQSANSAVIGLAEGRNVDEKATLNEERSFSEDLNDWAKNNPFYVFLYGFLFSGGAWVIGGQILKLIWMRKKSENAQNQTIEPEDKELTTVYTGGNAYNPTVIKGEENTTTSTISSEIFKQLQQESKHSQNQPIEPTGKMSPTVLTRGNVYNPSTIDGNKNNVNSRIGSETVSQESNKEQSENTNQHPDS